MIKVLVVIFAVICALYALVSLIKFIVGLVQRKKMAQMQKVDSAIEFQSCAEEEKSEKEV